MRAGLIAVVAAIALTGVTADPAAAAGPYSLSSNTSLNCSPNSMNAGASTWCTATVIGSYYCTRTFGCDVPPPTEVTGSVSFSFNGSTRAGCTLSSVATRVAICSAWVSTDSWLSGTGPLYANYSGGSFPSSWGSTTISLTLVRQAQSISFAPLDDRVYGSAPVALSASATSGLPVTFYASGACSTSGGTLTITGAGTCNVSAYQNGDNYYWDWAMPEHRSFTVTKAPLTVTANDASRDREAADPAFTARYDGFVNGDDADDLTGPLSFSTSATPSSPAGTYAITPAGLASDNYAITFVNGTLEVLRGASAPELSFADAPGAVDEGTAPHTFSYAISAGGSPVTAVTTSCGSGGQKVSGSDSNDADSGSFACVFADGPRKPTVSVTAVNAVGTSPLLSKEVTVANVAPTLTAMTGPSGEGKIGTARTWTLAGTDPSPVDQAQLKFELEWGDGRRDTLPSPASHTYGTPGDWLVVARALDKDGGRSGTDTGVDYVSGVAVAAAKSGVKKALMIAGTAADEHFTVKRISSTAVSVTEQGEAPRKFSMQSSMEIVLAGGDGDDTLVVEDNVIHKAMAFGGDGDDTIDLRNSEGVATGGAGADELLGDSGRDMLFGGAGKDELDGEAGEDVVAAGRVAWEQMGYADRLALTKLRNEWTRRNASVATRIGHLRGTIAKGANGTTRLVTAASGRTIFGDTAADVLTGGQGTDWFLADAATDTLDASSGETVTAVAGT